MGLLIIGLFLPWIIRIDYLAHAHCPNGPGCPPPTTDSRSLWELLVGDGTPSAVSWWLSVAVSVGPLLLVLLLQCVIALVGLRGRGPGVLFALGLICTLVVLALYLLAARVFYCLFHCGTGLYVAPGVRLLAPGFWLMLGGFLLAMGSDLAFLLLVGRRTGGA
jgi:hypothetical protein